MLLARHKEEGGTYAVKVLNKSLVLRKNEAKHIMSERNVLVKNIQHPFLVGLHYSFQTSDKLYFVLDYVNGGEVQYLTIHFRTITTLVNLAAPFTGFNVTAYKGVYGILKLN